MKQLTGLRHLISQTPLAQMAHLQAPDLLTTACPSADCPEPCPTAMQLSRNERVVLGQKCKQLIHVGREHWVLQQGFQAGPFCCPAVNLAS